MSADENVKLAQRVLEQLQQHSLTLATAESLTGGMLGETIVSVPGASNCYSGGVITYWTSTKAQLLGVDQALLAAGGPVQAEVATQMATGVSQLLGTNLGLATTGVAGPGDTVDGPAGRVYVAVSTNGVTSVRKHQFSGERNEVRQQAVAAVLRLAAESLER